MSKFQKRVESKTRIQELEQEFNETIEDFSARRPDLTLGEVSAVMLNMMQKWNDNEIKNSIK